MRAGLRPDEEPGNWGEPGDDAGGVGLMEKTRLGDSLLNIGRSVVTFRCDGAR
jgi:hypothetical protein